jgi:hypothetical protein
MSDEKSLARRHQVRALNADDEDKFVRSQWAYSVMLIRARVFCFEN